MIVLATLCVHTIYSDSESDYLKVNPYTYCMSGISSTHVVATQEYIFRSLISLQPTHHTIDKSVVIVSGSGSVAVHYIEFV